MVTGLDLSIIQLARPFPSNLGTVQVERYASIEWKENEGGA